MAIHAKKDLVFDFVSEIEEELDSGFLLQGNRSYSSHGTSSLPALFEADVLDEDFVPLSFTFESMLGDVDGSSLLPYSGGLAASSSSPSWEVDDCTESSGDSSAPGSPCSPVTAPLKDGATPAAAGDESFTESGLEDSPPMDSRARRKRQRTASLRSRGLSFEDRSGWSKEELLYKITHELPSDKLEGVILIVNPSLEVTDSDDESDLELDINALDDDTLDHLQKYVYTCLEEKSPGDEGREIITITHTIEETVTTSPRKRSKTKPTRSELPDNNKKRRKTTRSQQPTQAKRRKAPVCETTMRKSQTRIQTQVIETTICHFVEQDEHFNYIPHGRGARLNQLVPEAIEMFKAEEVIKVQKTIPDLDDEEDIDIDI